MCWGQILAIQHEPLDLHNGDRHRIDAFRRALQYERKSLVNLRLMPQGGPYNEELHRSYLSLPPSWIPILSTPGNQDPDTVVACEQILFTEAKRWYEDGI